ncbi:MAG: hypothetical protein Q9160_008492 [Pyrenula sp. 1 TL-2023]
MTPSAQSYGTAKLKRDYNTSYPDTDATVNGTRALKRLKDGGEEVGNGGTDYGYEFRESQEQIDYDFSLPSSINRDHPRYAGTCSRYDFGFLRSASSEEPDEHGSCLIYVSDMSDTIRPARIEESNSELVKDDVPRPPLDPSDQSLHNDIALAAIRDPSPPVIETELKAGGSTDKSKSEITDLGDQLYANLKTDDDQALHANSPIQEKSLQDRIFAELFQTQQESKGFFPKGRLDLIQESVVAAELTKCLSETVSEQKIQEYASQICTAPPDGMREKSDESQNIKSYRKIFAILVLIEKSETIGKFLDEEVHDGDLPLRKVDLGLPGIFGLRRRLQQSDRPSKRLRCFDTWKRINIINFEEWQWTLLAPFFARGRRNDVKNYVLPDQTILPFTKDSRRQERDREIEDFEGGFGRVFKTSNGAFAIKRLNSQDTQSFKREFEMLAKFSDDAHIHLVSLLAAYKQFNYFHFIFHWANADLLRFWMRVQPCPEFTYERLSWVARQCAGLASGLLKIHRYESIYERPAQLAGVPLGVADMVTSTKLYGRHGDIKPANILWFRDPTDPNDLGILKISDFGLAELHTKHSRSNRPKSNVAYSKNYRPPEHDLKGGTISRSYDIWTIACLYLEFIAWLLGGWALVKNFTIMRAAPGEVQSPEDRDYAFFELEDGGISARIKESVIDFIDKAHSHPACTEFLHEFLNMIQYDMLLVETSGLEKGKRIECGKLHQKLDEMCRKCGNSRGYAMTPAAWNRRSLG